LDSEEPEEGKLEEARMEEEEEEAEDLLPERVE
jgi:hypothetical protein